MSRRYQVHRMRFTNHELGLIVDALSVCSNGDVFKDRVCDEMRRLAARIANRDRTETTIQEKKSGQLLQTPNGG